MEISITNEFEGPSFKCQHCGKLLRRYYGGYSVEVEELSGIVGEPKCRVTSWSHICGPLLAQQDRMKSMNMEKRLFSDSYDPVEAEQRYLHERNPNAIDVPNSEIAANIMREQYDREKSKPINQEGSKSFYELYKQRIRELEEENAKLKQQQSR